MTLNKLMALCCIARDGNAEAVKYGTTGEDVHWLRAKGYIEGPSGGEILVTEKGSAHINAARSEDLIVQKWLPTREANHE